MLLSRDPSWAQGASLGKSQVFRSQVSSGVGEMGLSVLLSRDPS